MRVLVAWSLRRIELLLVVFTAIAAMEWTPDLLESVDGMPVDVDTKLALSQEAFWTLAKDDSFYRESRLQTKNIRQEVVELSTWVPKGGRNAMDITAFVSRDRRDMATPGERHYLQRAAHLVNSVTCPLGELRTSVEQDQTLTAHDGVMTYASVDSCTGVPFVNGKVVIKTIIHVTSEDDSPDSVRVRVAVSVGDLKLPSMLRWLRGRITSSIRADGVKQANKWLDQMVDRASRSNGGV